MNRNDYRIRAYSVMQRDAGDVKADFNAPAVKKAPPAAAADAIGQGGLLKVPRAEDKKNGDSVYRRVAKFLLLIGSDRAAEVLRFLSQEDIEKVLPEIAAVRSVGEEEAAGILEEFKSLVAEKKESGGNDAAFDILQKAFGADRAQSLMKKVGERLDTSKPFSYLKEKTDKEILSLLKGESPQVVALVLSYMESASAAAVINIMDAGQKKDVVLRLAKMQKVSPDVIQAIDKTIREKASKIVKDDSVKINGRSALSEILRSMEAAKSQELLTAIEKSDPDLGTELKGKLFTIQDVAASDDRFIQKKLSEMNDREIAYLIAGKDDAFVKKILSNVSTGRGDIILEEEAAARPMLKKDVDAITDAFILSLRTAWENGSLYIKDRAGEDEYV